MAPCTGGVVWTTGNDGEKFPAVLQSGDGQCLKVFESDDNNTDMGGSCGEWTKLHVGVCRQDSNNFVWEKGAGTLQSSLCPLKCLGVATTAAASDGKKGAGGAGSVATLMLCSAGGATGWSEVPGAP
jgi:hypothetical protein